MIKQAANLLMVPDVSGILKPNEIYVHFSDPFTFGCCVLTGDVVVFRSPVQLMSDIQVMKACDYKSLGYIKDCIVFSTQGEIPPASILSGGDYDGDKASVIWDERIVKEIQCVPFKSYNFKSRNVQPHELGVTSIKDLPSLNKNLIEYCSTQNAYLYLGKYSKSLSYKLEKKLFDSLTDNIEISREKRRLIVEDKSIIKLSFYCTKAVDAPKAGNKILLDKKLIENDSAHPINLQNLWFGDEFLPIDNIEIDVKIDEDLCIPEEDCIPEVINQSFLFVQEIILLSNPQYDESIIRELELKKPVDPESRICLAALCYKQLCTTVKLWNNSHELFYDVFYNELCRLKADQIALEKHQSLSTSVIPQYY